MPGSREFLLEVRDRTSPGETVAIAAPFQQWDGGYEYLYSRSIYPLAGRIVLPLLDEQNRAHPENLRRANAVAAYRQELAIPGFVVVWRGADGVLVRRTP